MTVFWIISGAVLFLILADIAAAWIFIHKYLGRVKRFDESEYIETSLDKNSKNYILTRAGLDLFSQGKPEDINIVSDDGIKLHARFLACDTPSDRTILCIHGYTSSGLLDYGPSLEFMHGCGCNVLLPDDRAHGRSGGRIIGFSYKDRFDCLSWCRYLERRFGKKCKIILYGISMGASTVISASGDRNLPSCVKGVLADCGFSSGWDEMKYQMKQKFRLPSFPILNTADIMLRIFAGYSLRKDTPAMMIRNTTVPVLIIHGRNDTYVPVYMAQELYANASCDKRLVLIDGAAHAGSYIAAEEQYEQAFGELMRRADF